MLFSTRISGTIGMEGAIHLENTTQEKNPQLTYLKDRLQTFLDIIDELNPESTNLEDIDRLIQMIDEIENTLKQK